MPIALVKVKYISMFRIQNNTGDSVYEFCLCVNAYIFV